MGYVPDILCSAVKKSFDFFKENSDNLIPYGSSRSLHFCSQFRPLDSMFGIPFVLTSSKTLSRAFP